MTRLYPDPFGPPWRFPWVRLILTWEGGIFQILWIEWLTAIILCSATMTATYLALKDNDGISDSVDRLTDAATFVARRFQAALALMLGFYTIQNFNRWREVRNVEGNIMGTVNDLALRISWSFRDTVGQYDETEEKSDKDGYPPNGTCSHSLENVRIRLIRWLNLSHAIVIGELYETSNAFSSLEKIRYSGLATHVEYHFLKTKSHWRYVAPLVWFVDLLDELKRKELFGVNDVLVNTLAGNILGIRSSLAALYMYRNVPIPLCYRQLTNMAVRMYMVILLVAATLTEKSASEESLGKLTRGSFWFIMVFAFEYFLFVGWLTVADAIGNPFRSWSDELEWENYVKALSESSLLLASGFRDESLHMPELGEKHVTMRWSASLLDPLPPPEGLGKGFKGKRRMLTGF